MVKAKVTRQENTWISVSDVQPNTLYETPVGIVYLSSNDYLTVIYDPDMEFIGRVISRERWKRENCGSLRKCEIGFSIAITQE